MTVLEFSKKGANFFFVFEIQNFENGQKTSKNGQKWPKSENFRPKFLNFFSESIQNVSKRILNQKVDFENYFPMKNFLWDSTIFWRKCLHSENFRPNFLGKKSFFRIESECFKTDSKPKKLMSKKIPLKFFLGLYHFFENGHIVKIPDKI